MTVQNTFYKTAGPYFQYSMMTINFLLFQIPITPNGGRQTNYLISIFVETKLAQL